MRIAICDDEKIAMEQTYSVIKKVLDDMYLKYSIDVYTEGNNFYKEEIEGYIERKYEVELLHADGSITTEIISIFDEVEGN